MDAARKRIALSMRMTDEGAYKPANGKDNHAPSSLHKRIDKNRASHRAGHKSKPKQQANQAVPASAMAQAFAKLKG